MSFLCYVRGVAVNPVLTVVRARSDRKVGKKVLVYAQRRDDALAKEQECTSAHQKRIFIRKMRFFFA